MTTAEQGEIEARIEGEGSRVRLVVPAGLEPGAAGPDKLAVVLSERGIELSDDVRARIGELSADYGDGSETVEAVVAESRPPEHGQDGEIAFAEDCDPRQEPSMGNESETEERVDFYNVASFVRVRTGDVIGHHRRPTPGVEGRDVYGETIRARPGRCALLEFDSTLREEEDGRLVAEADGVLQVRHGTITVSQLLELRDGVNFSSGNIDFDGDVSVRGDVRDRFVVKAAGSVSVNGLIEAATVVCGGNLTCTCGMAAKDRGQIVVDGRAEIGYLNNVKGRVGSHLIVRREIINCDLVIGGELHAAGGVVIGGRMVVAGTVSVGSLGSDADAPTMLVLGAAPQLQARQRKLVELAASLKRELEERGQQLRPTDPVDPEVEVIHRKLDACERRREAIGAELARIRTSSASVADMIHPRVTLRIGDRTFVFERQVEGPIRIGWNRQREIVYRAGEAPAEPLGEIAREEEESAEGERTAA